MNVEGSNPFTRSNFLGAFPSVSTSCGINSPADVPHSARRDRNGQVLTIKAPPEATVLRRISPPVQRLDPSHRSEPSFSHRVSRSRGALRPEKGECSRASLGEANPPALAALLRRIIVAPLLLWLLLALPSALQAEFAYTTNNNQITITTYFGSDAAVIIPDTINGMRVRKIGGCFGFSDGE